MNRPGSRLDKLFRTLAAGLGSLVLLSGSAAAAEQAPAAMTTIELSVSASQSARNDVGLVRLYAEHSALDHAAAAAEVNRRIASALQHIATFPAVKAKTAGSSSWPVYGDHKDNRDGQIKAWRMRSEIELESRDFEVLAGLIGKLQQELAIAGIQMRSAPETRRAAIDQATVAAVAEFERRAALLASTLGKSYRIVQLSVSENSYDSGPRMRALASPMMAAAEASPAPLEAGDSELSVHISGRIELGD